MIRSEVICDSKRSRLCHSLNPRQFFQPSHECADGAHGARMARQMAVNRGWVARRQPGRTPATAYICPACQEAGGVTSTNTMP